MFHLTPIPFFLSHMHHVCRALIDCWSTSNTLCKLDQKMLRCLMKSLAKNPKTIVTPISAMTFRLRLIFSRIYNSLNQSLSTISTTLWFIVNWCWQEVEWTYKPFFHDQAEHNILPVDSIGSRLIHFFPGIFKITTLHLTDSAGQGYKVSGT